MPCAPVTLLGITCDTGIEPVNAAPRVTQGVLQTQPNLAQLAGVCSPLFLSDYRLHRFTRLDQPASSAPEYAHRDRGNSLRVRQHASGSRPR